MEGIQISLVISGGMVLKCFKAGIMVQQNKKDA